MTRRREARQAAGRVQLATVGAGAQHPDQHRQHAHAEGDGAGIILLVAHQHTQPLGSSRFMLLRRIFKVAHERVHLDGRGRLGLAHWALSPT